MLDSWLSGAGGRVRPIVDGPRPAAADRARRASWPGRPAPGRGSCSRNAWWTARKARTPSALSTSTEILMSPVVIIFMLMFGGGQGGEHALGHAGVRPHAGADDRHLAHLLLVLDGRPQLGGQRPQHGQRGRQLVAAAP